METESMEKTLTEKVYVSFNFVPYHTFSITIPFHCLFISSDRYCQILLGSVVRPDEKLGRV
jgi:hypothetical protein